MVVSRISAFLWLSKVTCAWLIAGGVGKGRGEKSSAGQRLGGGVGVGGAIVAVLA